jgi:hypothetical protein
MNICASSSTLDTDCLPACSSIKSEPRTIASMYSCPTYCSIHAQYLLPFLTVLGSSYRRLAMMP